VLLAVLSSFRDQTLPNDLVVFGEVGLAGEIRPVPNGQQRLREAATLGFSKALVPAANAPKSKIDGLEVQPVSRYSQVLDWFA
jgi:DNA repair protein RadA/Sms